MRLKAAPHLQLSPNMRPYKRKHSTHASSSLSPRAQSQRARSVSPPSAAHTRRNQEFGSGASSTNGRVSHLWTIAAAQHHAQHIFDDLLEWISDAHTECTPMEPSREMSYRDTMTEMEVAYRLFVHATIEWKANVGVSSPDTEIPPHVCARRAAFTGLYREALFKLESSQRFPNQGKQIIEQLLEDNLRRIVWQCVSTTASHMTAFAEEQKFHFMVSSRTHTHTELAGNGLIKERTSDAPCIHVHHW